MASSAVRSVTYCWTLLGSLTNESSSYRKINPACELLWIIIGIYLAPDQSDTLTKGETVNLQYCGSEHYMAHAPPRGRSWRVQCFFLLLLVIHSYARYVPRENSLIFFFFSLSFGLCASVLWCCNSLRGKVATMGRSCQAFWFYSATMLCAFFDVAMSFLHKWSSFLCILT